MAQSIKLGNDIFWDSSGIKEKTQTGTLTGTVSSGNASFYSGSYKRYGNNISVYVSFTTTASVPEGGTIMGTVTGLPNDISALNRTMGWSGAAAQIFDIDTGGAVFIRNIGAALSSGVTISGTLIGMCTSL